MMEIRFEHDTIQIQVEKKVKMNKLEFNIY